MEEKVVIKKYYEPNQLEPTDKKPRNLFKLFLVCAFILASSGLFVYFGWNIQKQSNQAPLLPDSTLPEGRTRSISLAPVDVSAGGSNAFSIEKYVDIDLDARHESFVISNLGDKGASFGLVFVVSKFLANNANKISNPSNSLKVLEADPIVFVFKKLLAGEKVADQLTIKVDEKVGKEYSCVVPALIVAENESEFIRKFNALKPQIDKIKDLKISCNDIISCTKCNAFIGDFNKLLSSNIDPNKKAELIEHQISLMESVKEESARVGEVVFPEYGTLSELIPKTKVSFYFSRPASDFIFDDDDVFGTIFDAGGNAFDLKGFVSKFELKPSFQGSTFDIYFDFSKIELKGGKIPFDFISGSARIALATEVLSPTGDVNYIILPFTIIVEHIDPSEHIIFSPNNLTFVVDGAGESVLKQVIAFNNLQFPITLSGCGFLGTAIQPKEVIGTSVKSVSNCTVYENGAFLTELNVNKISEKQFREKILPQNTETLNSFYAFQSSPAESDAFACFLDHILDVFPSKHLCANYYCSNEAVQQVLLAFNSSFSDDVEFINNYIRVNGVDSSLIPRTFERSILIKDFENKTTYAATLQSELVGNYFSRAISKPIFVAVSDPRLVGTKDYIIQSDDFDILAQRCQPS